MSREMNKPFEVIISEHVHTVLRVCRAMVPGHDAEDAWSETFLAALRAYPDLSDDANIEAWLVTIARRKCIDILRTRKRSALPVDELPERHSELGVPEAADHDLWAAVKTLPPKQRDAVAYHYLVGLPYQAVAQVIGGTADAARRAAADGIKRLRSTFPDATWEGGTQ